MQNMTASRSMPLGWKIALLLPISVAVAIAAISISSKQTDLHAGVRLSMIGNLFLSVFLVAYSVYLVRKSTEWWTIAMLIFSSAVLGFGLHVLLRAF
jgi:hypothetical protein